MKKKIAAFAAALLLYFSTQAQEVIKPMPTGFDIHQDGIVHGQLDTLIYSSKTVDTVRRVLIYTPPGYSNKK